MGIKTKFNPMGGRLGGSQDKGDLSLWTYSNTVISDKVLLYNYNSGRKLIRNAYYNSQVSFPNHSLYLPYGSAPAQGKRLYYANGVATSLQVQAVQSSTSFVAGNTTYPVYAVFSRSSQYDVYESGGNFPELLYVPRVNGNSFINDWYNASSSGTTGSNRKTPFYNNPDVINVDLQKVPFRNDSMAYAFYNCCNLLSVKNISEGFYGAKNISYTFYNCVNFNQDIKIPDRYNIVNISYAFYNCGKYSGNLAGSYHICRKLVNASYAFYNSSVTNAYECFRYCFNLINASNAFYNTNITNAFYCFYACYNLSNGDAFNGCSYLKNMHGTYDNCQNLRDNVQIPYSVEDMYGTFNGCSNLPAGYLSSGRFNGAKYTALRDLQKCFSNCTLLTKSVNAFMHLNVPQTSVNYCLEYCNSITNMERTFGESAGIWSANDTVPYNVTQLAACFKNCSNLRGNIYIRSPKITNIVNTFYGSNNSLRKNIYIYFKYANGVNSATYNQFKANNTYKGTSGNGAGVEPMYNSTSNFYVYNLGLAPF